MKRFTAFVLALMLVAFNISGLFANAEGLEPSLTGNSCVAVINADNGQIVYSERGEDLVAPGCSTKLVALMLVWDMFVKYGVPLSTVITVPREATLAMYIGAPDINAPSIGLSAGNSYTAEDIMTAALIANANDACYTICHYAATELMGITMDEFVSEMNKKALEIGAQNTVYQNCIGLNSAEAHTTVIDTALIANAFHKYNTMVEMSSQGYFRFNGKTTVHNKNYLLSSRLLTGYQTSAAKGIIAGQATATGGYCLITTTESSDGIPFVLVIMDAPGEIRENGTRYFPENNAYEDMLRLIPWVTTSFSYYELVSDGELIAEIKVDMGKNYDHVQAVTSGKLELLINDGIDLAMIQRHIEYDEKVYDGDYNGTVTKMVSAPVIKGDRLGKIIFTYGGEVLGSAELVAATSVESSSLLTIVSGIREFLFSDFALGLIKWLLFIICAFVLYSIVGFIIRSVASARENSSDDAEDEEEKPEKPKKKRKKSK